MTATAASSSSSFGPILFVGLCVYTLMTAGPAPVSDDPASRMDMPAAARPAKTNAPDPMQPEPDRLAHLTPVPRGPQASAPAPGPETAWRIDPPLPRAAVFVPDGLQAPGAAPATPPAALPLLPAQAAPMPLPRLQPPRPDRAHRLSLPIAVLTADLVHLRDAPSARAPVLGQLASGEKVVVLGTFGNWTRVQRPDSTPPQSGWVYSDYLSAPDTR